MRYQEAAKYAAIRGKVTNLKRLPSSVYGNPRWEVTLTDDDGIEHLTATSPNAMLAYAISNAEYRDTAHTFYVDKLGHIGTRS